MTRHVILGSGVAGVAALEAIRSADPAAQITLVADDAHGFYSRPGLAYYLSGELPEKQLYIFTPRDWQALQVGFVHAHATRILPGEHRLELGSAGALTYDRLLLAIGATAMRLDLPCADLQGVVFLDDLEDTRRILHMARRGRTAVVVGGGILALELVEGLRARGMQVHFFLRGERYWTAVLDEAESRLVEERLRHEGVHIHAHTEIAGILGRKNKVQAVRTTQGEVLPCSMVACGIGVKPRIELAQEAGLAVERGILVDERLQTSAQDIYAAGDIAQVYDPLSGKKLLDLLWLPARRQGETAGANMTGQQRTYQRAVAVNVLRLAGIMTSIIGAVGSSRTDEVTMTRGSSETWQPMPGTIAVASGGGVNLLRLLVDETTIRGAVVMGEQTLSLPLQELISTQADISSIRAQLLSRHEQAGQILLDFWVARNANIV
jgi:NAD(P)H-nitrite reductase large subunit